MELGHEKSDRIADNMTNFDASSDTAPQSTDRTGPSKASSESDAIGKAKPKMKGLVSRFFNSVRDNLFYSLTRRIIFLNLTALAILLATILYMNQFRQGLIDAKIESLLTQGRIIASAIASSATASPDSIIFDQDQLLELERGESIQPRLDPPDNLRYPISPEQVAPFLRPLISPTQTRARIYDRDGLTILDSRLIYDGGRITSYDLTPLGTEPQDQGWIEFIGNTLNRILGRGELPIYREGNSPGTQYPEVQSAMTGAASSIVRLTPRGELTVFVALPIQRFRVVLGVLQLSTEGDDIDKIVREERIAILRIFLVAAIVMLVLSVLLASTIAAPLRKLSDAAIRVKRGVKSRVAIPDFSNRKDEVGDLSVSISEMTGALYQRIEAIERFAADVSHELKNPLTSLRSAVETLPLAKTPEARDRLTEVIQHDVKRLDRLITDISDASRLDADLVRDHIDSVEFDELVSNVIDATRDVVAKQRKVKITLDIDRKGAGRRGFAILGHDSRLGQVINNLLDNAISFVPPDRGRVAVQLRRDQNLVVMTLEDNGPGIQAEDVDRIFERFYTDRSEFDGFGQNSGLGLSISRQIIEAHGGTISASNRDDGVSGARFEVILPAEDGRAR